MVFLKKFISIWNEIKKLPGYMGKTAHVDQLNDTTAFPWFLNFCKNFSADYRKCKSNRWDYLISIHDFKNPNEFTSTNEEDQIDRRTYLIKKYNERLLAESNDKYNPWVIDDRDDKKLTLHRKKYLEFEKALSCKIDEEITNKILDKTLFEKDIQLETNRLSLLAKLEILKIYKEENITFNASFTKNNSYWQAAEEKFDTDIMLLVNKASIYEIRRIKKEQEEIINELHDYFSSEKVVNFYPITSVWEKINAFLIKNKLMQFFSLFWCGFSSHANLLSWISFLLVFFSLSLCSYPIIFLMLGISLVSYLGFNFFYLVKKKSIIFPEIITYQTDHILESVKIAVFNEEKNEKEWELIGEMIQELSGQELSLDEKCNDLLYPQEINAINCILQESELYQFLIEVYPKTQLIASTIVNLSSVMLYTYLLTWAMHSILMVLGAVSFASFIACPAVVGVLIFIIITIFLIRHFCEFSARKNFYQRFIENQLNKKSIILFEDENENQKSIQIEKWKKFEFLQKENYFLVSEIEKFFQENKSKDLNNKFTSLFNNNLFKRNIYTWYEQDKVLGSSGAFFTRIKKILNRFFAFSGGGFYGYNLTQQIVWKSNLGLHIAVKIFTLPLLLIFLPIILINGVANLITYHYHSRQQNRFEIADKLDSKLKFLEQTYKKLLRLRNQTTQLVCLPNSNSEPSSLLTVNDNQGLDININAENKFSINKNCFFSPAERQKSNLPSTKGNISRNRSF